MAYILHIDTSADTGLTAVSNNGEVVSQVINTETRNHASSINLHIEQAVTEAGIQLKDLSAVSVCGGPGSYTGLRIGLSTAKGLCYILNIPLMMHSKLVLLSADTAFSKSYTHIIAILQARESEYFVAVYDSHLKELVAPQHVAEEQLSDLIKPYLSNATIVGYSDSFINELSDSVIEKENPNISSWGKYAAEQYSNKHFANLEYSEPFYLKQVYTHKPKNSK